MVNDHEDNHQLALVDPQLSLGSELFELFRLKDLQIILVKQQASWGTWLVVTVYMIIRRRGEVANHVIEEERILRDRLH